MHHHSTCTYLYIRPLPHTHTHTRHNLRCDGNAMSMRQMQYDTSLAHRRRSAQKICTVSLLTCCRTKRTYSLSGVREEDSRRRRQERSAGFTLASIRVNKTISLLPRTATRTVTNLNSFYKRTGTFLNVSFINPLTFRRLISAIVDVPQL